MAAAAALVAAFLGRVDGWVGEAGAVATAMAYTWGLAARTAGRPVIFASLAVALGVMVAVFDAAALRDGAAVVTAVLTAVFAVIATVPASTFLGAVRETVLALVLAAVGSLAHGRLGSCGRPAAVRVRRARPGAGRPPWSPCTGSGPACTGWARAVSSG